MGHGDENRSESAGAGWRPHSWTVPFPDGTGGVSPGSAFVSRPVECAVKGCDVGAVSLSTKARRRGGEAQENSRHI